MIYRNSKEKIEEYFQKTDVIGQSRLKLLPLGVDVFNQYENEVESDLYFEEKTHFILGSGVDVKLTGYLGAFFDHYYVMDCKKPSDKILSIIQMVFDAHQRTKPENEPYMVLTDDNLKEALIMAIDFHTYQPKWKPETRLSKIIEEGEAYYGSLIESMGKQILSLDEFEIINSIVDSILADETCGKYFKVPDEDKNLDVYFQKIIEFEIMGVPYHALLDMLVINHQSKTLQVIDIKTLADYTMMFPTSMRKRRYDFQVYFYTLAVAYMVNRISAFKDYTILEPAFIVETTKPNAQGRPLFFQCTPELKSVAQWGRVNLSMTKELVKPTHHQISNLEFMGRPAHKIWGIMETVELHRWYLEHGFEKDKVVVETNNCLKLNWEGIEYENTSR